MMFDGARIKAWARTRRDQRASRRAVTAQPPERFAGDDMYADYYERQPVNAA